MQCADKSKFGVLGMNIFLGWTIASLFIPRIADLFGRKPTFVTCMIFHLASLLLLIFSRSYEVTATSLFFIGMCSVGRWTVGYIYLLEFWTEMNIKRYGPFVAASSALALVFGAFTLQVITSHTIVLEYTAATMTFISIILAFSLMPESPKWLIS